MLTFLEFRIREKDMIRLEQTILSCLDWNIFFSTNIDFI